MRLGAWVLGVMLAAVPIAGCAATPTPTSVLPSAVTVAPTTATVPPGDPTPASIPRVQVNPALLDVLPPAADGVQRIADPDTAAEIATSVDLAASVESIAVAVYVGPGSSAADDLAIASVARLRPGVFSDAWFRQWRETYDASACEPAGGVQAGSAQAEIAGVTTYIGSCANLVHTYHVRLTDPDRVVAITAFGERRLGERIVEGLTE